MPPPIPPEARRPPLGFAIASWMVILGIVLGVFIINEWQIRYGREEYTHIQHTTQFAELRWMAQYSVTMEDLLGGRSGKGIADEMRKALANTGADDPDLQICKILATIAIGQSKSISTWDLSLIERRAPLREEVMVLVDSGPDNLSDEQKQNLIARYGWFAQAALNRQQDGTPSPAWKNLVAAPARARTWRVLSLGGVGLCAFLVGIVLLITGFILLLMRTIRLVTAPPVASGRFYAESFALYLVLFMGGSIGLAMILPRHLSLPLRVMPMLIPVALAAFWPVLRGVPAGVWRRDIGLHAGRGVFTEMLCGIAAYLAGLPLLVAMMFGSVALNRYTSHGPQHPIQSFLGDPNTSVLGILLVASFFAPLTEEVMFRGVLFQSMRPKFAWPLSALVSSVIFAAIHPQGWTLIPALATMGGIFCVMRQWRGSLIPSMTAHAIHNTFICCLAAALLR